MARSYGIDLGTSRTKIACLDTDIGQTPLALDVEGSPLVPSVVWFDEASVPPRLRVGQDADDQRINVPQQVVASVKLQMGKSAAELAAPDGDVRLPIAFNSQSFGPVEISSEILKYVVESARSKGHAVRDVVVTVPAEFNFRQREATVLAIKRAGLQLKMLLSEPVAALLANPDNRDGAGMPKDGKTLVFDLGGGTLDCTVISIAHGENQVLAKTGGLGIAGDHIDRLLYEYLTRDLSIPDKAQYDTERHNESVSKLMERCRRVKELLSESGTTEQSFTATAIYLKDQRFEFDRQVSRAELETLLTPLIGLYQAHVNRALQNAGLSNEQIDKVLLVGGSTRIPIVRRSLDTLFPGRVQYARRPDLYVAYGAAIAAAALAEGKSVISDTLTRQVGKQDAASLAFVPLIARGTSLKEASATESALWPTGAKSVAINVYEAEEGVQTVQETGTGSARCSYVGTYELTPTPMPQNGASFSIEYVCNPQTTLLEVNGRLKGGGRVEVARHNAPIGTQSVEEQKQARLDLMVLLDTTGSMRHGDWERNKADLREAVTRFWDSDVARSGNLNMRAALTTFGDARSNGIAGGDTLQTLPFTPRHREFCDHYLARLDEFATEGGDDAESCYDALWRAANTAMRTDPKTLRAFVLITNGRESAPPTGNLAESEIVRELQARDIVVYPIAPYHSGYAQLAEDTGGAHCEFDDGPLSAHLRTIFREIGKRLNPLMS